jgi:hypothetical protein
VQASLPASEVLGGEAADDPVWGVEKAGEGTTDLAGDGVEGGATDDHRDRNHDRHDPSGALEERRDLCFHSRPSRLKTAEKGGENLFSATPIQQAVAAKAVLARPIRLGFYLIISNFHCARSAWELP